MAKKRLGFLGKLSIESYVRGQQKRGLSKEDILLKVENSSFWVPAQIAYITGRFKKDKRWV